MPQKYLTLDLFSGCGGLSKGLEDSNIFKTCIYVDLNSNSLKTFKLNIDNVTCLNKDISLLDDKKEIIELSIKKKITAIVGGPPCQGFSLKGKKMGLKDKRNYLINDFLDIVERVKPKIVLIENVKQMILSQNGYFSILINKRLEKMGYFIDNKVLNAKWFSIPQNRERAFILASNQQNLLLPPNKRDVDLVTVKDAISDLAYHNSGEGAYKECYKINNNLSVYSKKMRKGSKFLYNHIATKHSDIAIRKLNLIPAEKGKEFLPKKYLGKQKFSSTWCRLEWNSVSPTIDTRFDTPSNGKNSHPYLNRAITPREAARIQSFNDDFIFCGNKTSICRQIGNAVPPLLSKQIGLFIKKQISNDFCKSDVFKIYQKNSNSLIKEMLKRGDSVNHIITDPPYKISRKNNFSTLKNSSRHGIFFGEWDLNFNVCSWIKDATKLVSKNGSIIIFCSYIHISYIISELEENFFIVKDVLHWIKTNPMPRNVNRRYVNNTEYAVWAVRKGSKWIFNKPSEEKYVKPQFWSSTVSGKERTAHPNQKSLDVMSKLVQIHTNKGDSIFDPFMGSGTTGVASIQNSRKFIGCEISKNYFNIAKKRILDYLKSS